MTILRELIEQMKSNKKDNLQQIRELCDRIMQEEKSNITHKSHLPVGPNIFLALEVPGRNSKEVAYLTLERETEDLYLAVLYTIPLMLLKIPTSGLRRQMVWEIEDHRPEKILTEYAKHYKYLRGE